MSISTIFEQSSGQIDVPLPQLVVGKSCSFSTGHGICLAQLIGREIGHGAADSTEVEDSARVLGELYSMEGSALDGAFDLVDGCVEAALCCRRWSFQSGTFSLCPFTYLRDILVPESPPYETRRSIYRSEERRVGKECRSRWS